MPRISNLVWCEVFSFASGNTGNSCNWCSFYCNLPLVLLLQMTRNETLMTAQKSRRESESHRALQAVQPSVVAELCVLLSYLVLPGRWLGVEREETTLIPLTDNRSHGLVNYPMYINLGHTQKKYIYNRNPLPKSVAIPLSLVLQYVHVTWHVACIST